MIIQTFYSVLVRNCKISKYKNAVILSKMFFFSLQKGRCTSSICQKHLCKVLDQLLKHCRRSWLYKLFLSTTDRQTDRGNNIIRHGDIKMQCIIRIASLLSYFIAQRRTRKENYFYGETCHFFLNTLFLLLASYMTQKWSSTSVLSIFLKIDIISFIKI